MFVEFCGTNHSKRCICFIQDVVEILKCGYYSSKHLILFCGVECTGLYASQLDLAFIYF